MVLALALPWIWLSGCAAPLRHAPGQALLADSSRVAPALAALPPDSIDAELSFLAYQGRGKTLVSGRLFARPGQCGKLDLYGLPGMLGGAFHWRDAVWELAIYDPPRYQSGQGHRVPLPFPGGLEAPYDALFAPLWGAIWPWAPGTALRRDPDLSQVLSGAGQGGEWRAHIDAKTGLPDTLWDMSQGWVILYSHWKKKGERPYPSRVLCRKEGQIWLEIEVRGLRDNPVWRRNPFVLRKPAGT